MTAAAWASQRVPMLAALQFIWRLSLLVSTLGVIAARRTPH
jgi:hypothetical protein